MNAEPFSLGAEVWPGIGKLVEEAGEVLQVCGKLIGTGGADAHWDGGDLRGRMTEEIADLLAAACFVVEANGLDRDAVTAASERKFDQFRAWRRQQGRGG